MDLRRAQSIVETAIGRSSQNKVAKAIDIDPAALSRWLRGKTAPTGDTKTRILDWAEKASEAPSTRGRVTKLNTSDAVGAIIRAGQEEQIAWVREFAARVLEASAQQLRALPNDISIEELEADDLAINDLEDKVNASTTMPSKTKRLPKRATG